MPRPSELADIPFQRVSRQLRQDVPESFHQTIYTINTLVERIDRQKCYLEERQVLFKKLFADQVQQEKELKRAQLQTRASFPGYGQFLQPINDVAEEEKNQVEQQQQSSKSSNDMAARSLIHMMDQGNQNRPQVPPQAEPEAAIDGLQSINQDEPLLNRSLSDDKDIKRSGSVGNCIAITGLE